MPEGRDGDAPRRLEGRYDLLERIGRGTHAEVWRALDRTCGTSVAVKMLPRDATPVAIERLRREAQALAKIVSSRIVRLLAVGEDQGRHYLVLELLEGRTLAAHLEAVGSLSLDEADAIVTAALEAAGAAHRAGIVHRDLSSANVFIVGDGSVKVLDFGVAAMSADEPITDPDDLIGAVRYVAPEQLGGGRVGPAADQYAIGTIAFRVFAGALPFGAANGPRLLALKRAQEPPVLDDAPPAIARVVARMLALRSGRRYPSVEVALAAWAAAIREAKDAGFALAPAGSPTTRARAEDGTMTIESSLRRP